ncbi:hypothetical protein TWF281_007669 [Arthrobotrys megalospora]
MTSLDTPIKNALKEQRRKKQNNNNKNNNTDPAEPLASSQKEITTTEESELEPGETLEIDEGEWNAPTVVFFAENKFISRFTGGRELKNSVALNEPFISPFIDIDPLPGDTQEMKFNFELDLYKDELLEGPHAPASKKWEEKMVFKRDATVADWLRGLLAKVHVEAVEKGVTDEEMVWGSIQVGRMLNDDAWTVMAAILRVSVEARRGMVWVRRRNGHFLLIKKEEWDRREEWDLDKKDAE